MEIFKTTAIDGASHIGIKWGASQTEAAAHRKAISAMGYKPVTQTVSIPTSKGPLVDWLNENVRA